MLLLLSLFGLVASNENLCQLQTGVTPFKVDLPADIVAANKIRFDGFNVKVSRAESTTGSAYFMVTGYSSLPSVEINSGVIVVSSANCADTHDNHSHHNGTDNNDTLGNDDHDHDHDHDHDDDDNEKDETSASRSRILTPSWFPFACAAVTAMVPSLGRFAAVAPLFAWFQGALATESCTPTVEITLYLPPETPMTPSVRRPDCKSVVYNNKTADKIVGGTLYVYDTTATGNKTWMDMGDKAYVDLASASIAADCAPKHKPHMVRPSPDNTYSAVTYTGDQDFAIMNNADKSIVQCPSVEHLKPSVFGGAVHDGAWYTKNTFLSVDMTGCVDGTCGGAIHRHDFTYDGSSAMTAATYVSSLSHKDVGVARNTSGTKPISLGNNPHGAYSQFFYVTDAKGAGSIMNADTMTWDTHFHKDDFGNCSKGGLWVEPHPKEHHIVVAQYGTQDGSSCIFVVDMQAKTLTLLSQLPDNSDAHGVQFCETDDGQMTVLNTNRQTSTLDVINYTDGTFLATHYDMNAMVFDLVQAAFLSEGGNEHRRLAGHVDKLQPDVAFYHGEYLYMAARGPRPVSAVKSQNFYENAHPGLMALKIDTATCLPAADQSTAFALTVLERSPEITADVHSLWGVMNGNKMEIWAVDQAGTGSVQQYDVYSACAAYGVEQSEIHDDPSPHQGD